MSLRRIEEEDAQVRCAARAQSEIAIYKGEKVAEQAEACYRL